MNDADIDNHLMAPTVTIGVPLYNGAATLRRCIDSLLAQTYPGCLIHIADDGSRDNSRNEANTIVAEHPEIRLTLQSTNLGPAGNFGFLLRAATTDYFMWVAADDQLAPSYVQRMLSVLDARADVVACVSLVEFARGGYSHQATGAFPLRQSVKANLAAFLSDPSDNARLYALYRRVALTRAFPNQHFHAYDWAATAGTLVFGKHELIGEKLMFRDATPSEDYLRAISTDNARWIDRVLPLLPMTRDLLVRQKLPLNFRIVLALFCLNLDYALASATFRARAMKRPLLFASRLWRRAVVWRLKTRPPDVSPL